MHCAHKLPFRIYQLEDFMHWKAFNKIIVEMCQTVAGKIFGGSSKSKNKKIFMLS